MDRRVQRLQADDSIAERPAETIENANQVRMPIKAWPPSLHCRFLAKGRPRVRAFRLTNRGGPVPLPGRLAKLSVRIGDPGYSMMSASCEGHRDRNDATYFPAATPFVTSCSRRHRARSVATRFLDRPLHILRRCGATAVMAECLHPLGISVSRVADRALHTSGEPRSGASVGCSVPPCCSGKNAPGYIDAA